MCQFWEHTCGHRTKTECDLPRKARDPNAPPEPVILRPDQDNPDKPFRERGRPTTPPGKYKAYYGFYFDMSRYSRIVKPDYCYGFDDRPKKADCPCYGCVMVDVEEKIKIEAEEMKRKAEHDEDARRLMAATEAVVNGGGNPFTGGKRNRQNSVNSGVAGHVGVGGFDGVSVVAAGAAGWYGPPSGGAGGMMMGGGGYAYGGNAGQVDAARQHGYADQSASAAAGYTSYYNNNNEYASMEDYDQTENSRRGYSV